SVGVAGSGTMASGIAEVFAKAGYTVVLAARGQEKADLAKGRIAKSLERSVAKGRLTAGARDETLGRITAAGSLDAFAEVDLAVEAVAEDLAIKQQLFATLDKVCRPGAVLATTTSSLPVVAIARATARPEDVIGMHFFNPAPAMKLVEVVRTVLTADDVHATVRAVCAKIRKHPVDCGDRAGFIVNALLFPYLNNAIKMVEEHYASLDDIDAAMKLGCGLPMGPLALLDLIGIDTARTVLEAMYSASHDRLHAPAPILGQLSEAGLTGRKAGRGFYTYEAPGSQTVVPDALTPSAEAAAGEGRSVTSVG
ncbi:hypothetical protein DDE05_08395, partial [Streptomyces cavourensis]